MTCPVYIVGAGMTRFGRYPDRTLKQLAGAPLEVALADAGLTRADIEAVYFSNSMAGIVTGQESVRGQTVLTANGIGSIPVVNVENACASGSTAVNQAFIAVGAGVFDVVLVLGVEKIFHSDRAVSYRALAGATDIEEGAANDNSSSFLKESGKRLARYMEQTGATIRHVAAVAEKSRINGSLNELAQYQEAYTVDEILASPIVSAPLTRLMCSPIGDGAAALVICSQDYARRRGLAHVRVAASVLGSCAPEASEGLAETEKCLTRAYEAAALGPEDMSLVELHDTTAASELMLYERLGLCSAGGGPALVESGATRIGGTIPVNPSGGLIARGHPVGATGLAQLCELYWQLRGRAGQRQIEKTRAGLAHNAGGTVNSQPAAIGVHILTSENQG